MAAMREGAATIGRDSELDAIASLLDPSHAALLLLEGDAGIGKTTLVRAAIAEARALGWRVLTCSPTRSETELSLAALRDLLDTAFGEIAGDLPAPQRRALAVALLREEPSGHAPTPDAIAVAFLAALRALGRRGATLIAVDDVQWLDAASASALAYASRRLEGQSVAVLLARRLGDDGPSLELDRLPRERVAVLRVGPLSTGALGRILYERLGMAFPRSTLHRFQEVSGGNPLFALELARAVGDLVVALRPGEPLPVPETLRDLVRERILSLPPQTLEVLRTAAAASRPTLALLRAATGRDVADDLAPAIAGHVAGIEGDSVRFAHPLFANAIDADLSRDERHVVHRRLASITTEIEQRARHLALASEDPDEAVAATIMDGARRAFGRGGPAAAAELAAHARRLTPVDAREAAWERTLAQADYVFAAGDTRQAAALLDDLARDAPPGAHRARALSRVARMRHFESDIGTSVALLDEALAEARDDAALRGEIEEGLAWGLLLIRRDLDAAVEHARTAARIASEAHDDARTSEALAAQALCQFVLGLPWRATMDRALELEYAVLDLRVLRHPSFAYGYALSCSDELDAARVVFTELRRRADDHGDESSLPSLFNHLAMVEALAGNWPAATAYADEGLARAIESGQRPTQAAILGRRALVAVRRGALDEARGAATRSLAIAAGSDFNPAHPEIALARGGEVAVWALGAVELAVGDAERAHAWLGPLCDGLVAAGIAEPGEVRALPEDIDALVALRRLDDAQQRVARLDAWASRVDRPSVHGLANRSRGVLLAARGEDDAALRAFEAAAAWHARGPLRFEHARSLLALGAHQRHLRMRKTARETLERAATIFAILGARLWADRVQAELARIGGRRSAADELTPTERQIAALVAEGKKNKEVAAALVVAERTVESALTLIYRKLDVRSRTELARKLSHPD
jgi:DNA-binding CsgD family transcriptional regulator